MKHRYQVGGILIVVLILAASLRWVGLNWDDYSRSHPDELFLTTIASEVGHRSELLDSVRERCADDPHRRDYFNTQCSAFNPNNIEDGSFAYGTLPVFMVSGAGQIVARLFDDPVWREFTGIHLVGRFVNILAELVTVTTLFLIGRRLYGARNGLLAAMLYAAAALPIQLTHFWAVDIIANMFFTIALYAAVVISQRNRAWAYVLFGLALGAGGASRINVMAAAALAPFAALVYLWPWLRAHPFRAHRRAWLRKLFPVILLLVVAFGLAAVVFRVAQPYAFKGPHIWDVALNQKWLDDMEEVSNLAANQSDGWPPTHQFVDRVTYLYPWFNMIVWGMGLPLGAAVTAALIAAVWRQARLLYKRVLAPEICLLLLWILLYFGWHGRLHYMTLRYYLPLYGVCCLLAVWWMSRLRPRWARMARRVVVIGTFLWAFMFTSIYRHPQTRVEAALWIRDHFPTTLTGIEADGDWAPINPGDGMKARMVTFLQPTSRDQLEVYSSGRVTIKADDPLFTLDSLWLRWTEPVQIDANLQLYRLDSHDNETEQLVDFWTSARQPYELNAPVDSEDRVTLTPGRYRWKLSVSWSGDTPLVHVIPMIQVQTPDGPGVSPLRFNSPYTYVKYAHASLDYVDIFQADQDAVLTGLLIPHVIGSPEADIMLGVDGTDYVAHFDESDHRDSLLGDSRRYVFDQPVRVYAYQDVWVRATEPIWFTGTAIATEGHWDFSTPHRICFRDSEQVGVLSYKGCRDMNGFDKNWYVELPIEVVEHDNPGKEYFMGDALLKADYYAISSNRMYDALPRNPPFYWYTTEFYSDLFAGRLGYEQIKKFERFPGLGPLVVPDQVLPEWNVPDWLNELEAEEAYTVYDHPTVYIFKNASYALDKMTVFVPRYDTANRVDLAEIVQPTYVAPLTEPSRGDTELMVLGWALVFLVTGWLAFPLMFVLFPSLPLRGYGFGRGAAWLLLAIGPWWLTSMSGQRLLWTRTGLLVFAGFCTAGSLLAYRRRSDLRAYVGQHWPAMLALDLLWLAAFGLGLLIRGVNPDYWHDSLGGEKHMDLAFLNAIWRTGEFPPPSPWLSGFSANYYYLGFVIVAMPLKALGIAPEIGPNLALAGLFATVFVQVFCLGTSVLQMVRTRWRITLAVLGVLLVMLAGNYGTLKLIVDPESDVISPHRWYWYPSRILSESANGAGGVFNEVPFFSFLYGDLHAHIIALVPVTLLLACVWALVQQRERRLALLIGMLVAILYMTNPWDILVYVPLVVFALWVAGGVNRRGLILAVLAVLGGLVIAWPYLRDFTSGYGSIERWQGPRSLLEPFLLVWGGPLIALGLWIAHRVKVWLTPDVNTPVELGVLLWLFAPAAVVGGADGTSILLGLMLLTALILAWNDRAVRYVHLGVAFFLAGLLAIEHVVVVGDVARMNTGAKVSFQLWLWVGLLIPVLLYRMVHDRRAYVLACLALIGLLPGFLFPIKSLPAREADTQVLGFSLNGFAFMETMPYISNGHLIHLADDADLIRFMRHNLRGYPVIAEAYVTEYHWNTRIASYTGLPTVVGWQNHLRQQYPHQIDEVQQRVDDIKLFYATSSPSQILELIKKYGIQYIVSGELELTLSEGRQRAALQQLVASGYLSVVYQHNNTFLYRVEPAALTANAPAAGTHTG